MDQETIHQMLKSLEMAKEHFGPMERKREEKLWGQITLPANLKVVLTRLTKEQLNNIRQSLDLKNLSTLKKQELSEELLRHIPAKASDIFLQFDQERYDLVKRLADNGGYLYVDDFDSKKAESFRDQGIIFTGSSEGKKVLVLPVELINVFREIDGTGSRKVIQRNTEWILLTNGLLHYYGILDHRELENMLVKFTGEKPILLDYLNVMYSSLDYYNNIRPSAYGFCNREVSDPKRVLQEQITRPSVDFYSFTKNQLLQAGQSGFVESSPAISRFISFLLAEYQMTKDEAVSLTSKCITMIRLDNKPSEIIPFLQTRLELPTFEAAQLLVGEVVNMCNNTRQWTLKGHTPHELSKEKRKHLNHLSSVPLAKAQAKAEIIDIRTRKKVGRNDRCPCGSGKKYKHCCDKA